MRDLRATASEIDQINQVTEDSAMNDQTIEQLLTNLVVEAQREAQGGKSDTSVGLTTIAIEQQINQRIIAELTALLDGWVEPPEWTKGDIRETLLDGQAMVWSKIRTRIAELEAKQ